MRIDHISLVYQEAVCVAQKLELSFGTGPCFSA